jgi:hypothetical protein
MAFDLCYNYPSRSCQKQFAATEPFANEYSIRGFPAHIFITGTDTGVGKTLVTALLAIYLQERGLCRRHEPLPRLRAQRTRRTESETHFSARRHGIETN